MLNLFVVMFRFYFVLSFIWLFSGCNQVFFQPTDEIYYRVDSLQVPWQDIYIPKKDSSLLHARLFPSQQDSSKGLLIHFHGNAQNLTSHFLYFLWITQEGYDYLIFDYSGYGESSGFPSRIQAINDGTQAIQYAWDHIPSSHRQLIIAGQSLGGALMVPATAFWPHKDSIDLLILDATFDRYPTEARRMLSNHWFTWLFQGLGWLLVSGDYNPEDYYPQLHSIPTLVTHCADDRVVNSEFSREIFSKLSTPRKKIWTFPVCGHAGFFVYPRTQGKRKLLKLLRE